MHFLTGDRVYLTNVIIKKIGELDHLTPFYAHFA